MKKKNYSIFHSHKKKIPPECNQLTINDVIIDRVSSVKYLGVQIDDKLTWNEHVKQVSQTLVKYASSFKIIKNHVPEKRKKQLYYAYAYSKLLYGIEVYGHTSKRNIKRLQVNQNRMLKILYNKDWYTHTNDLHKELDILQIRDIFNISLLKMVYKQRNNELPGIFNHYFKTRYEVHNRSTRNCNKLEVTRTRTRFGNSTLKYQGAKLFNELPAQISNCKTLRTFKAKVKNNFISSY